MTYLSVSFDRAIEDVTGGNAKIQRRSYLSAGSIPVIDQGQADVAGYTDNVAAAYRGPTPAVLFGDHTRCFKYVNAPFALGADGVKVLVPKDGFDAKFLYYYFISCDIPSRGYSRHFKFLREVPIPAPPPTEQHRIVELLDEADRLRKLRSLADKKALHILPVIFLDMFGDPSTNPMDWSTDRLDRLFHIVGGGTPSKTVPDYWAGDIPWVSPKDMKSDVILDSEDHITEQAVVNSATRRVSKGSILIVYRSGILAHTFPVAISGRALTINQDVKALSSKGELLNEYLYGWLIAAKSLTMGCVKKGATVHNIDGARFRSLQLAKPPIELQERFASHLTSFLALKKARDQAGDQIESLFSTMLQRAFSGQLTAKWREAHMEDLLSEMAEQARLLNLPEPQVLVS